MFPSTRCTFSVLAILALGSTLATDSAWAQDASCAPVMNAMTKASKTPYHEFATAGEKSFEKIYTTTALYLRVGQGGGWRKISDSPQSALMDGIMLSECKSLRADVTDGQPATVYAARVRLKDSDTDNRSQIWIGSVSGLPLKSESDTRHGDKTLHVSTRFTYDNVQAPVGTH